MTEYEKNDLAASENVEQDEEIRKENELHEHRIVYVEPESIADDLGVESGDVLVSINGQTVEDVFDYRYLINDEEITVLIRKKNGEEWELQIEKEYDEDLGIDFENTLMDSYRSCRNKCVFCFIDQLPEGMRKTLYFKDDDSRLSFIQGNYLTLTNMSEEDLDRIIRYRLEPVNISFHTLHPELRCRMLNNRFAGQIIEKADRLHRAGIEMNGQIVLCRGLNDGEELEYSLKNFEQFLPELKSVSIVPVGLTRYRRNLYPLEPFTRDDALKIIAQIERWQQYYYQKYGTHLVHPSDEWYIMAARPLPPADRYDGYLQIENGVGMIRSLTDEVHEYLDNISGDDRETEAAVATGLLAYPYVRKLCDEIRIKYPNVSVHVYPIQNVFFGERITVAGLLTGQDLKKQLSGKVSGIRLLLTKSMLKAGEPVFLDDVSVPELEKSLQTKIRIVESDGEDFVNACIEKDKENI